MSRTAGTGMTTFGPLARLAREALPLPDAMAAGGGTERLGRELLPDDAGASTHLAGSALPASPDRGGHAPIVALAGAGADVANTTWTDGVPA